VENNIKTNCLSNNGWGEKHEQKNMIKTGVLVSMLVVLIVCFSVFSSYTRNDLGVSRVESASSDITHVTSDVISADIILLFASR